MKILIGWDGSDQCRKSCELLAELVDETSRLTLCHVLPKPEYDSSFVTRETSEKFDALRKDLKTKTEAEMKIMSEKMASQGLHCHFRTEDGDPESTMVRLSDDFDLVVVGARGFNPVTSFLLGSIPDSLVRHSDSSVLIYRGTPDGKKKKGRHIIFGYDGQEDSEKAGDFLLKLCRRGVGKVSVVMARKKNFFFGLSYEESSFSEWPVDEGRQIKSLDLAHRRMEQGFPEAETGSELMDHVPDIADALCDYAQVERGDLLVAGSHHKDLIERIILGSVSVRLSHHAPIPLLIVK